MACERKNCRGFGLLWLRRVLTTASATVFAVAFIDDLVSRVDNEALREDLEVAVKKLRATRQFGLVYEEHTELPVAVPDLVFTGAVLQPFPAAVR